MESDNVSSGFDSAGPFSGGDSDGLKNAIRCSKSSDESW